MSKMLRLSSHPGVAVSTDDTSKRSRLRESRRVKAALRRGADVNAANLRGNTCLHFCFAFGFTELGEYLITKGADNRIVNASGKTCYEGLG